MFLRLKKTYLRLMYTVYLFVKSTVYQELLQKKKLSSEMDWQKFKQTQVLTRMKR